MIQRGEVVAAARLAAAFVVAWTVTGLGAGLVVARCLHRNVTQPKEHP